MTGSSFPGRSLDISSHWSSATAIGFVVILLATVARRGAGDEFRRKGLLPTVGYLFAFNKIP